MKKKNIASVVTSSQLKKSDFSLQQISISREKCCKEKNQKKSIRYPHSNGTVKLSPPCPYCFNQTGLVIIRFKDDSGFVRCARCDAALYSLNEQNNSRIKPTHAVEVLNNYLPTSTNESEVAS
ncbi:MAG: hypothetical protein AAF630_06875 [Cyanobacteria bacterium P01_C01_bin.38]